MHERSGFARVRWDDGGEETVWAATLAAESKPEDGHGLLRGEEES
jgi:hypothetical protein